MSTGIAVISDTHCNSTVALLHPLGIENDDGATTLPSKAQRWLWECWNDYWTHVEQRWQDCERRYVVINGDAVEGNHHSTPQLHSLSETTQQRIAVKVFERFLELDPDAVFLVRGTESHVGHAAKFEENLAEALGCEQSLDTNTFSHYHLRMEVDGVRLDLKHHGRTGYRPWTRANATSMLAAQMTFEAASMPEDERPHVAVRSHTHNHADSHDNFPVRVIQTYPWQLSTSFGHRVNPGVGVLPVGGMYIECASGEYEVKKWKYEPERPTIWRPSP